MEELHGRDITHTHIGRIDQSGWEIEWISDTPLDHGGATIEVRHTDTGNVQLWDIEPDGIVWLRDEVLSA